MPKCITQIPFPGSSGETPTGALQFQNDWPGLFVRGDRAVDMHRCIRYLQQQLAGSEDTTVFDSLHVLGEFANIIERDVMVREEE